MNTHIITAKELLALLTSKSGLAAGEVYEVSEPISPESGTTLRGNGATVICESGFDFKNVSDVRVDNLKIESGEVAVKVDLNCKNIGFKDCKISADNAIVSSGSDVTLQDCEISAKKCGIISSGRYFIAKNNKITADETGIEMTEGSYNSMAAQNKVNAAKSILVKNGFNCVVVMNDAENVICENNTHLYVIKNTLSGNCELGNNKHLICDSNEPVGEVINKGNSKYNGDNLHDVNARLDCGADEELLPHTDPDQYLGMERRDVITDLNYSTPVSYTEYILRESSKGKTVIVPPGAYTTKTTTVLSQENSDTDFYSYGAYIEATFARGNIWKLDHVSNLSVNGLTVGHTRPNCGQVHVVEVNPEKNTIKVVVAAGFADGFLTLKSSDKDDVHYNPEFLTMYHQKENGEEIFASDIYGGHGMLIRTRNGEPCSDPVTDNGDGTYTMEMTNVNFTVPGDILVTRLGERGQNTIFHYYAKEIKYKDLTVFAITNATANRVISSKNVTYERYHAARPNGFEITRETYDKYVALGEKYGIDFGVYYDDVNKIYRGPRPIWGGSSSMEVGDGYSGTKLKSCILESSCDDGSNQRGSSSRIAGMVKNDDGTYTVYYKGNFAWTQLIYASRSLSPAPASLSMCATLEAGDIIVAYTTDGRVLINDAPVLTDPVRGFPKDLHLVHTGDKFCDVCGKMLNDEDEKYPVFNTQFDPVTGDITFDTPRVPSCSHLGIRTWKTTIYSVKIDAKYVNESLLDEYDFCMNVMNPNKRIVLDNISKNCTDIVFDNVLLKNIKSRGLLAKTNGVTVKHSTFRDLTLQALVLGPEQEWSESTISRNVVVEHCIFDNCGATNEYTKKNHTGYDAQPNMTAIDIRGVGATEEKIISGVKPHSEMLAADFVIRHNKFLNTRNDHMISVTGARDVMITDNDFEERDGDGEIIYINGCYNVNVTNNEYTDRMKTFFDEGNQEMIAEIYNCEKVKVENLNVPEKVTLKPNR